MATSHKINHNLNTNKLMPREIKVAKSTRTKMTIKNPLEKDKSKVANSKNMSTTVEMKKLTGEIILEENSVIVVQPKKRLILSFMPPNRTIREFEAPVKEVVILRVALPTKHQNKSASQKIKIPYKKIVSKKRIPTMISQNLQGNSKTVKEILCIRKLGYLNNKDRSHILINWFSVSSVNFIINFFNRYKSYVDCCNYRLGTNLIEYPTLKRICQILTETRIRSILPGIKTFHLLRLTNILEETLHYLTKESEFSPAKVQLNSEEFYELWRTSLYNLDSLCTQNDLSLKIIKNLHIIKMYAILNLGAVIILIYLCNYHHGWQVIPNETSIISRTFVEVVNFIPTSIIILVIYTLILLLLYIIFTKKYHIVGYIIALALYQIGFVISIDLLALKDISAFPLCKIYHPIPYDLKLQYYFAELSANLDTYNKISPPKDDLAYEYIKNKVTFLVNPSTISQISHLDAEGISKLAYTQISEIYNSIAAESLILESVFTVAIVVAVFSYSLTFCAMVITWFNP